MGAQQSLGNMLSLALPSRLLTHAQTDASGLIWPKQNTGYAGLTTRRMSPRITTALTPLVEINFVRNSWAPWHH